MRLQRNWNEYAEHLANFVDQEEAGQAFPHDVADTEPIKRWELRTVRFVPSEENFRVVSETTEDRRREREAFAYASRRYRIYLKGRVTMLEDLMDRLDMAIRFQIDPQRGEVLDRHIQDVIAFREHHHITCPMRRFCFNDRCAKSFHVGKEGNRRKMYCSDRCRLRQWVADNREKHPSPVEDRDTQTPGRVGHRRHSGRSIANT